MKVKLSMSCLMLAMALGAPAALAAATVPEMNRAATSLVATDVPAMTEEQLKTRMEAVAEALKGSDAAAVRKALAGVSISGMAISDAQVRTILDQLKKLAAKYPAHADAVKRDLFKVEHLTIGRLAPNIKGKDTDGVAFELADYRGKVVVIDFWGDW